MHVHQLLGQEHHRSSRNLKHLSELQHEILAEFRPTRPPQRASSPVRLGDWWYTVEFEPEGENQRLRRFATLRTSDWTPPDGDALRARVAVAEVLIDDAHERGHARFYERAATEIGPDGTMLAFTVATSGDETYEMRIRTASHGPESLSEVLHGVAAGFAFHLENRGIYYLTTDATGRPDQVWFHAFGRPQSSDTLVYVERDERFWVSVGRSRSGYATFISVTSHRTTEWYVLDAQDHSLRLLRRRVDGVHYDVDHAVLQGKDFFLFGVTDKDGTRSHTLTPCDSPQDTATAHHLRLCDDESVLLDVQSFKSFLLLTYRQAGFARVGAVTNESVTTAERQGNCGIRPVPISPLHGPSTVVPGDNMDWHAPTIRVRATSFLHPPAEYEFDLRTHVLKLLHVQDTPAEPHVPQVAEARIWATAEDNVLVPVTLVSPTSMPGRAPFVVFGYGAYGTPVDPTYSQELRSLLSRGIGFAIVHTRGGGEMGAQWHRAGSLSKKERSFTDFIRGTEALIESGWADPGRMVAEGHSAGGLLVAVIANRYPSLFRGVLARAPFVNPLDVLLDPALPLSATDWEEFGNPRESPEARELIASYSPLQNVRPQAYPRVFAEVAPDDPRVSPADVTAWVRALRSHGADADLRVAWDGGHHGATGVEAQQEQALQYAWIVDLLREDR